MSDTISVEIVLLYQHLVNFFFKFGHYKQKKTCCRIKTVY